jgi:hypothetical protein
MSAREVADAGAATGAHEHVGRNEYMVTGTPEEARQLTIIAFRMITTAAVALYRSNFDECRNNLDD